MAVLDALPGVEVSVHIDGKPVQEYEDTDEEVHGPLGPKTVVKYIEAISDAQFSINASVLPVHKECVSFRVHADGKWITGRIYDQPKHGHAPWNKQIIGSRVTDSLGQPILRPFKFAGVNIVEVADATTIEKDAKIAASLGELVIDVVRVKVGKKLKRNSKPMPSSAASEIAEKAVKGRGLSHGTAFGPAITARGHGSRDCDYLDGKDKPLARFIFRYRSKDALRKLLIIPRSPTPDPFDALPAAERERLARVAFERESADKVTKIKPERRVKREHNEGDPPVNIGLASDMPAKRLKKTSMSNPIDLTDD